MGATFVIFFGLVIIGLIKPQFIMSGKRFSFKGRPSGYLGSSLIGLGFAAGWTPCTGPILAALGMTNPSAGLLYMIMYIIGFSMDLPGFKDGFYCEVQEMKTRRLMIRAIILLILGGAVGYTLYANLTKNSVQKLEVGKEVPDFALVDLNGKKHRLSDYKGQGVFLNFWATWCKPCEKEMPYINNQYNIFKNQGVQVLAVDVGESKLAVSKFVERKKMDFPVLIDTTGEVQTAYGIDPLPTSFIIDKEGKLVKIHTGALTEAMVKDYMEQIKP